MPESEQTMTRYLLGELSEAEQSALEQRYFTDPQVFDQVVQAENQLVDDYIRGELSPQARARLEQYYLAHPKRRERAKFAQALATKLDQVKAVKGAAEPSVQVESWWDRVRASLDGRRLALGFSMALLLIVIGGIWSLTERRRLHGELAQTQAARAVQEQHERELQQQLADERTRINDLNDELSRARSQVKGPEAAAPAMPTSPAFVTLLLTAGGTRGSDSGSAPKLMIPTGTEQVRIQLNLKEGNYPNYRVVLQAIGGETIFSRQGVKPKATKSGSVFVIIMPARRFAAGDYILTLRGVRPDAEVDDVSKSIFRVERK